MDTCAALCDCAHAYENELRARARITVHFDLFACPPSSPFAIPLRHPGYGGQVLAMGDTSWLWGTRPGYGGQVVERSRNMISDMPSIALRDGSQAPGVKTGQLFFRAPLVISGDSPHGAPQVIPRCFFVTREKFRRVEYSGLSQ